MLPNRPQSQSRTEVPYLEVGVQSEHQGNKLETPMWAVNWFLIEDPLVDIRLGFMSTNSEVVSYLRETPRRHSHVAPSV